MGLTSNFQYMSNRRLQPFTIELH